MDSQQMYTDPRGHKYMQMELAAMLYNWSCKKSVTQEEYDQWYEIFMTEYNEYNKNPVNGCTFIVQIFAELSRSRYLLTRNHMLREQGDIQSQIPGEYDHFFVYQEFCDLPVLGYTQSRLMQALLFVSEQLQLGSMENLRDFDRFVDLLFVRNAVLVSEHHGPQVLDIEAYREIEDDQNYRVNLDYLTYTCIYLYAALHRIFYRKEVDSSIDAESADSTRQWIERSIMKNLNVETFDKLYQEACEEAYDFPGDRDWFRYRFPHEPVYRQPVLECIRPHYAKRFCSEHRISQETVLATMQNRDFQGYCSRLFLMRAVHRYLKDHFDLDWLECIVLQHEDIEPNQRWLFRDRAPYLVQFFTDYAVFYKGSIYQSENIYQVLGTWFRIVERDFDGKLLGCRIVIKQT